ncbi:hypothetical protein [Streptomyces sp. NPDC059814]
MNRLGYAAEVTVSDRQRFASLGGVTVRNRRLALVPDGTTDDLRGGPQP